MVALQRVGALGAMGKGCSSAPQDLFSGCLAEPGALWAHDRGIVPCLIW